MVGTVVVVSVVVAFTILVEWHELRGLDAIGPILFLLSFITQLFPIIYIGRNSDISDISRWGVWLLTWSLNISVFGIVVSILVTIWSWQTNKFDIRTPSVIHNLPFLG
jgi:hypothetical protein